MDTHNERQQEKELRNKIREEAWAEEKAQEATAKSTPRDVLEQAWQQVKAGKHTPFMIAKYRNVDYKIVKRMAGVLERLKQGGDDATGRVWNDVKHLRAMSKPKRKS